MSTSFADLGVSEPVVRALRRRGINTPFPIQRLVIEDVLDGEDVLVQSPTGSGKTLAFGVPIVERLDPSGPRPAALVLAPTRELASQIQDELASVCAARGLKSAAVYGGVGIQPQIKAVRTAQIVVATPGRLEDLIQRRAIRLDRVRVLVLDEADRMLDMGFRPAVDRIVSQLPGARQTLFFSATLEGAAGALARAYTRDPRRHVHAPKRELDAEISHRFAPVSSQAAKLDHLHSAIEDADGGRALVFVRTKRGADRLTKKLERDGVNAVAMHGNKSQSQRQRALARFERGELQALVATDVAARGIDVAEITHVINFDLPADAETYTHRVGRTGRAGASGEAITFVLSDQLAEMRAMAKSLPLDRELTRDLGRAQSTRNGRSGNDRGRNRGGRSGGGRRNRGRRRSTKAAAS